MARYEIIEKDTRNCIWKTQIVNGDLEEAQAIDH